MTSSVLLAVVLVLLAVNVLLWKYGFVHDAEKPESILDRPVMDAKERRAVLKRLTRWREEGRLTREEYEQFYGLCQSEWDPHDA